MTLLSGTVADLLPGDRLHSLNGVGFGLPQNAEQSPVLVADVRPAAVEGVTLADSSEILTSIGPLLAPPNAPTLVERDNRVTANTVLLISRRQSLHATLLTLGIPVLRRAPLSDGPTTTTVTPQEWASAGLIVIDGYLALSTIRSLIARAGITARSQVIMVCTDPDDATVYTRQQAARASTVAVLPHESVGLQDLFRAAVGAEQSNSPWFGILLDNPAAPGA